eukprot:443724_1
MTQTEKAIIVNFNLIELVVYGYIREQEQILHLQIPLEIKHLCQTIVGCLKTNTFLFDYNKLASQHFYKRPTAIQLFLILNRHCKESIFLDLKYIAYPAIPSISNGQYILSYDLKRVLSYNNIYQIEHFYNEILNYALKYYQCFMTPFDMEQYHTWFIKADTNKDGIIDSAEANRFFSKSTLNRKILATIWDLTKDHNYLNEIGFCIFLHIVMKIKKSAFDISYWKNKNEVYELPFYLQQSFLTQWSNKRK